jgi:hypothetical protein
MQKYNVKLQDNCKFNPVEFTVQVTCDSGWAAGELVKREYKNMTVLSVDDVVNDEIVEVE